MAERSWSVQSRMGWILESSEGPELGLIVEIRVSGPDEGEKRIRSQLCKAWKGNVLTLQR
jgi:hypothetical protein